MNNKIVICNDNFIYIIDKEPYETDENTYIRGWYIIKNFDKFSNKNELISNSLIYLNEKKNNMKYII
jgi:hypothetical protein